MARTDGPSAGSTAGDGEPPAPTSERIGLRQAAMVFSQADGGLAAYAAALLNSSARPHAFELLWRASRWDIKTSPTPPISRTCR